MDINLNGTPYQYTYYSFSFKRKLFDEILQTKLLKAFVFEKSLILTLFLFEPGDGLFFRVSDLHSSVLFVFNTKYFFLFYLIIYLF